ncbi:MAG: DUF4365 domain-containing protein [Saprospiraceae bacterium]|nr:DUF4365 domain-containing protein [Saprospiraceae bacterium]
MLPKRSKSHKIDEKSIHLIQTKLNDDWIVRNQEGTDYGIDLQLERYGEIPTGDFIFVQVKGTEKEFDGDVKLSNFPVKTINYSLLFSIPFFVFYTSITSKKVRYVWLQKYVELNLDKNNPDWKKQSTVTIEFPEENDIDININKIISISNNEKRIKIAHKYVMLYERFYEFHKKLLGGDLGAAKICHGLLNHMIKTGGVEEFRGDIFLGPDDARKKTTLITNRFIYDKAQANKPLDDSDFESLKMLNQSLRLGKLHAVNIELSENLGHWMNDTLAY